MGEFRLGSEIICSKGKEPVAWSCFGSILGEFEVILSCIGIGIRRLSWPEGSSGGVHPQRLKNYVRVLVYSAGNYSQ